MGSERKILDIPLNRAEGDLEVRVEINDGVVTDAWCAGTMYRGFENLLVGRGALDGLMVTPRICGICTTTHLMAAASALDAIAGVTPADSAVRLRNIALMTETLQSDLRQSILMFMADFANEAHATHPLHDEAVQRYAPVTGRSAIQAIKATRRLLEVVSMVGGQWPHSSFMVPGGVVHRPSNTDLLACRQIVADYRDWYETSVLGCPIERWREVRSAADLDAWLDEAPEHRDGDLGFLLRFGRDAGLDVTGNGPGRYLSFGSLDLPQRTSVKGSKGRLVAAGLSAGRKTQTFDPARIAEHVGHSWFEGEVGGVHPGDGATRPRASGADDGRYSWVKAPRYGDRPAETGPLAEFVVGRERLFLDLVQQSGSSALVRQLARLVRPAATLPVLEAWLAEEMANDGGEYWRRHEPITDGQGAGLIQAARGALGHWVEVADGRIQRYQIITPTAWNASPRDDTGRRGPMEEALVGTPVADPANPVEIGYVVRSFDPCLVCSVHTLHNGRPGARLRIQV